MKQGTAYVRCIVSQTSHIFPHVHMAPETNQCIRFSFEADNDDDDDDVCVCVCVCRFEDAGHYYWLLAKSYLDHAKRSNTGQCVCVCVCVFVMVSFLDRTKW